MKKCYVSLLAEALKATQSHRDALTKDVHCAIANGLKNAVDWCGRRGKRPQDAVEEVEDDQQQLRPANAPPDHGVDVAITQHQRERSPAPKPAYETVHGVLRSALDTLHDHS